MDAGTTHRLSSPEAESVNAFDTTLPRARRGPRSQVSQALSLMSASYPMQEDKILDEPLTESVAVPLPLFSTSSAEPSGGLPPRAPGFPSASPKGSKPAALKPDTPPPSSLSRGHTSVQDVANRLELKVRNALAVERRRDLKLAHVRAQLVGAAADVRKEAERIRAAEQRLLLKEAELERLLKLTRSLEQDRDAAREGREALEGLSLQFLRAHPSA